jgi:hypothetical protein
MDFSVKKQIEESCRPACGFVIFQRSFCTMKILERPEEVQSKDTSLCEEDG